LRCRILDHALNGRGGPTEEQEGRPCRDDGQGCLQKGTEANTYMLTNVAGGRSYELIGTPSDVNLAPHVGHKIDVTGTAVAANRAAKAEGVKGAAKKAERGERHLQVQSFKMVAASCR
jgi:hypothetical protein